MVYNPRVMGNWDRRFIELARHFSTWSKDPSTQVGCVVVGPDREVRATGYNGFPRGVKDTEERLHDRELKYQLVVHAEENTLLYAARIGVPLKGCTAYVTWPPCTRCSVSLIQAGIMRVVYPQEVEIPERWRKDFNLSQKILAEAGVIVETTMPGGLTFPVHF
jgi:dCMP deaminase